jgi:hypothetical protein
MSKQVIIELVAKTKEATETINALQEEVKQLRAETEKSNDTAEEGFDNLANSAKKQTGILKKIAGGFKGIGVAIKGAGIALVIKAFDALFEVLKQNQQIADFFAVTTETISQVLNQVVNALVDTYNAVKESTGGFDALGRVLSNLLKLGLAPIKAAFFGLKLGIQQVQLAWEKWLGDADPERIKELNVAIEETKNELKDIAEDAIAAGKAIGDDIAEAIEEVTEFAVAAGDKLKEVSISAAKENAKVIVELRKQSELASARNQGLIEQYDRQAEQLRQIRDDETKTIAERIAANEKLGEVLEEQKTAMLENAKIAVQLAEYDVQKNNSLENQKALLEAQNELAAIEAQITGFQSEQLSNRNALIREGQELTQSEIEAENERAIAQAEFLADQIEGEYLRLEAQKAVAIEEARLEEERLENKKKQYKEGTQAFVDANNELLAFQQENQNKQLDLDKQLQKSKQQLVGDALSNLATIVGENSKFGKGIAVVQAIRDTFAAANTALKSAPPPFNFISAAATVAAGIANVKAITTTAEPSAPSFARSSGGGGGASVAVPTPPQINTVGTSGVNQLAETINAQTKQPIKAFVVSGEVTTAQSLERNAVKEASI